MGNETMNYKLPKPGEDDFYDIAEFNKAMDILDDALTGVENEKLDRDGDASDTFTEFNQGVLRENLTSGEKLSVSLGKIKKWFAELNNVAFSGKASDITEDSAHRFVEDSEKNNWNGKVSKSGGDISNTKIDSLDTITAEFPVPEAGETSNVFWGKVRKFIQDFNDFKTGIITVGKLVNNGQTTGAGYALDARYGKTLYDLYTQLNSDLLNKMDYKSEVLDSITAIKEYYNTLSDYTIVSGFGTHLDPLNDGSSFAGMYTIQRHVAEYGTIMILTNGLIFTNFRSGGKWGNWELYSKNSDLNERLYFGHGTALQVKHDTLWYRMQVNPEGSAGIFKSTDNGVTWPNFEKFITYSNLENTASFGICFDCNNPLSLSSWCDYSTLNTPYKAGLTNGASEGRCLSVKTNNIYNSQLFISNGAGLYYRPFIDKGIWDAWKKVF